ncbi:hypothetical protein RUND412_001678 [Rhizina undulata]
MQAPFFALPPRPPGMNPNAWAHMYRPAPAGPLVYTNLSYAPIGWNPGQRQPSPAAPVIYPAHMPMMGGQGAPRQPEPHGGAAQGGLQPPPGLGPPGAFPGIGDQLQQNNGMGFGPQNQPGQFPPNQAPGGFGQRDMRAGGVLYLNQPQGQPPLLPPPPPPAQGAHPMMPMFPSGFYQSFPGARRFL